MAKAQDACSAPDQSQCNHPRGWSLSASGGGIRVTPETPLNMMMHSSIEGFKAVVLNLVGGTEPHKFHTCIHRTLGKMEK